MKWKQFVSIVKFRLSSKPFIPNSHQLSLNSYFPTHLSSLHEPDFILKTKLKVVRNVACTHLYVKYTDIALL